MLKISKILLALLIGLAPQVSSAVSFKTGSAAVLAAASAFVGCAGMKEAYENWTQWTGISKTCRCGDYTTGNYDCEYCGYKNEVLKNAGLATASLAVLYGAYKLYRW